MKKSLLSAALILLLILAAPSAYADTIYPNPPQMEVGDAINYLAASTDPEVTVSITEGFLPEGVTLVTELADGEQLVYLRGAPQQAGSFPFVISMDDNNSVCTLEVTETRPALPNVTASSDVDCYEGDDAAVAVFATTYDGGTLSYQWYAATSRDGIGGAEIAGANLPEYRPGTAYPGTTYYYCAVTNTLGSYSSEPVLSPAIAVTVKEVSVEAIAVESMPVATQYKVGDPLDTQGLQIRVFYTNGNQQLLDSGFGVYPVRLEKAGEQSVEVSYQGAVTNFTVKVVEPEAVITGIGIQNWPVATTYTVGDSLNAAGLAIRAYYDDGSSQIITNELLICEPLILDKVGTQTVTVTYMGKTCTFDVTVQDEEKPEKVEVWKMPTKTSYTVGETLDTAGMFLRVRTNRGNTQDVSSGFTCTPTLLSTPGRQEITVQYGSLSTSFHVTVSTAAAPVTPGGSTPASPAPSQAPTATADPNLPNLAGQSPAPASTQAPNTAPTQAPAATVNPRVSVHESHRSGIGSTLIAVVVIAALLALAVLGLYVFIMSRGGLDRVLEKLSQVFRRK